MRTVEELKKSLVRGSRVLVSKAFLELYPDLEERRAMCVTEMPGSLSQLWNGSHVGWGQELDVLFVVSSDLPVVGYAGRIVAFGGTEGHLALGWADEALPSLDADLWIEALPISGARQLDQVHWTSLVPVLDREAFAGSFEAPILFLDRDNVIVPDIPYNKNPEMVSLNDGICSLIERAHHIGWWVAMASNQSGLGRQKIRFDEYASVHRRLQKLLAEQGQWLDESEWAGFVSGSLVVEGQLDPQMRKPRPGMFWRIQRKLKGNLRASMMIGDSASDLLAATQVGIEKLYLLKADHYKQELEKLERHAPGLAIHVIERFDEVAFS